MKDLEDWNRSLQEELHNVMHLYTYICIYVYHVLHIIIVIVMVFIHVQCYVNLPEQIAHEHHITYVIAIAQYWSQLIYYITYV